jgi:hypothetical protein
MNSIKTFAFPTGFQLQTISIPPFICPLQNPFQRLVQVKGALSMSTETPKSKGPRRFAPLREGTKVEREGLPRLKGVVFDVDGTLW